MSTGVFGTRTSPNGSRTATPVGDGGAKAVSAPPLLAPRRRRRPAVLITAVMLAAAGGGIAATTSIAAGHRAPVLALARDVPLGAVLTPGDLTTARVASDPALHPIPSSQRSTVLGQHAAVALVAGSLLTPSMLTASTLLGPGQALVAVPVKPGELPAREVVAGDHLLAVTGVDNGSGAAPNPTADTAIPVTVADVGQPTSDGTVVVDVVVAQANVVMLARQAAAGEVALVLLPAGGGSGS
jgi:hypothetical protein